MFFRYSLLALLMVSLSGCGDFVRRMIYYPPQANLSLSGLPPAAGMISVRTSDGLDLDGIFVPGAAGKPLILTFHGNAASADGQALWLAPLTDNGYALLAGEYRGYSGNPGQPTQAGLAMDADAFLARARELAGGAPIYVLGHSLGGGVAFDLALRAELDLLITVSTFTSIADMAPAWAGWMVPDPYDNRAAVGAEGGAPLAMIHGRADSVVPFTHGEALAEAAGSTSRPHIFVPVRGDHAPAATDILAAVRRAERELLGRR